MNLNSQPISSELPVNYCASSDITPKRKSIPNGSLTPMYLITAEDKDANTAKKTPIPINPFDVKAESLYFHSCSPFFATLSRNKKDDGTFRWSIDQLSVLYPADIDESALPDTCVDSDQEMKAQKAIDAFFSQSSIVPSPWSESPPFNRNRNDIKLRRASHMVYSPPDVSSCEIATQTALSIPPDVDLKGILGQYFTFNDEKESTSLENSREETDSLSSSSLRRKLFVTEEECISPSKVENKNLFHARLWSTPTARSQSAHSTPASDVLSSSPITPRNCSETCNVFASPPVSPITSALHSTSVQMNSFDEQRSTEMYYSPGNFSSVQTPAEIEMSFLNEHQETNPFPSNQSEKQDTGYVTGSISSSANMNFSEVNYGLVSRITPVMELMEECELSNSTSCDMSYRNIYQTIGESVSFEGQKTMPNTGCHLKTYPWVPTCSSTPAERFHNISNS